MLSLWVAVLSFLTLALCLENTRTVIKCQTRMGTGAPTSIPSRTITSTLQPAPTTGGITTLSASTTYTLSVWKTTTTLTTTVYETVGGSVVDGVFTNTLTVYNGSIKTINSTGITIVSKIAYTTKTLNTTVAGPSGFHAINETPTPSAEEPKATVTATEGTVSASVTGTVSPASTLVSGPNSTDTALSGSITVSAASAPTVSSGFFSGSNTGSVSAQPTSTDAVSGGSSQSGSVSPLVASSVGSASPTTNTDVATVTSNASDQLSTTSTFRSGHLKRHIDGRHVEPRKPVKIFRGLRGALTTTRPDQPVMYTTAFDCESSLWM